MAHWTTIVFNEMCPTLVEDMASDKIHEIRKRENASSTVFSRYLNATTDLVSRWEHGRVCPVATPDRVVYQ